MEGASDTSSSIIIAAIQAFVKWPEVQRRAWKEIDAVVGDNRSPVWGDYDRLPYCAATVKEAMRWRPVVPLAFPHALTEDGKVVLSLYSTFADCFRLDRWIQIAERNDSLYQCLGFAS